MHNIRVLREKMGLSQQQVAEAVHVSQQAVARWESGLAKPRADLLPQLASLFNCTIDELFWTPGNKKPPAGPGEERGERCGGIFSHRFCPIGFWLPLGWIRNLLGKRKPQVLQDSVALTVALCGLCRQFTLYGFPSVLILVLG